MTYRKVRTLAELSRAVDNLEEAILTAVLNVLVTNTSVSTVPLMTQQIYTLQRPADTNQYAAHDVIADATSGATQPSVLGSTVANSSGLIRHLTIWGSSQTAPLGMDIRLYIYSTAPAAQNDNAAFATTTLPDYYIDLPPFKPTGGGSSRIVSAIQAAEIPYKTDNNKLFYFVPVTTRSFKPLSAQSLTFLFQLQSQ